MTIWVNVSTSATLRLPPFGITRVERRMAFALREVIGSSRVRYCVWDGKRGVFDELVAAHYESSFRTRRPRTATPVLGARAPHGKRAALGAIMEGVAALAPEGPRKLARWLLRLPGRLMPASKRAHADLDLRAGATRFRKRRVTRTLSAGCLKRGDVLITLGLEWEAGFMPLLPEIKERAGIRVVGCVHDLIPIKYPQYCVDYVIEEFPRYLHQLAQSCEAIACVSDCSLNDLRAWFLQTGVPIPHLFRLRLGADLPDRTGEPTDVVADLIDLPYLLFVSTIERRKNHEVLYRAFHRLARKHNPDKLPRLLFVGAQGWGVSDLLRDMDLDPLTQGLIVRLHDLSDNDLRILYEHALFCVFPSLYEGWGLPVAEALALGKPVISSDQGALPEVGGDLVEYLDPWDLPGWVGSIERLWLDEARRQRMAERVVSEYVKDDWLVAAEAVGQLALSLEVESEVGYPPRSHCAF